MTSSIAPRYQATVPSIVSSLFSHKVYQNRVYASGPSWDRNENNTVDVEEAAALQMASIAAVAKVPRVEEVVGGAEDAAGVKATTRPRTKTNGTTARTTVCPQKSFLATLKLHRQRSTQGQAPHDPQGPWRRVPKPRRLGRQPPAIPGARTGDRLCPRERFSVWPRRAYKLRLVEARRTCAGAPWFGIERAPRRGTPFTTVRSRSAAPQAHQIRSVDAPLALSQRGRDFQAHGRRSRSARVSHQPGFQVLLIIFIF